MTPTVGVMWGINAGSFGATLGVAAVGHPISIGILALQVVLLFVGFAFGVSKWRRND